MRNASGSLKTVATAQADFRWNDRDSNGIHDYWTGDIAGLFAIDNTSTGARPPAAIKLIEVSVALADIAPRKGALPSGNYSRGIDEFGIQSAKGGYWYGVLSRSPHRGEDYAQETDGTGARVHNRSHFGAASMPESYGSSGNRVFIIDESNVIHVRDFGCDVLSTGTIPPTLSGAFDGNWPMTLDEWGAID